MRRGTTPTVTVSTDIDLTGYKTVWLTLVDEAGTELTIKTENLQIAESDVSVTLTQEQSLSLKQGMLQAQIRAVNNDGKSIASDIMIDSVEDVLKDGVIS